MSSKSKKTPAPKKAIDAAAAELIADSTSPEHRNHGDSRAALLKAASKVFAKNGFDGTTVKDLADEAGVNVSMVSYYFGGKEGLYKTILENFGLEGVASTERLLKPPRSREEFGLRLGMFAESIFEMHVKEPELVRIIHRSMDMPSPLTDQIFENVFARIFEALQNFIDASRDLGILRQDLDTEIVAECIFGSVVHFTHCEDIRVRRGGKSIQDSAYVDHVVKTWLTMFTEGLHQGPTEGRQSTRTEGSTLAGTEGSRHAQTEGSKQDQHERLKTQKSESLNTRLSKTSAKPPAKTQESKK